MERGMEQVKQFEGIFTEFPKGTPTSSVPDGPLFGNGDIGVTVGGIKDTLTFWVAKNDFWSANYGDASCLCQGGVKGLGKLQLYSKDLNNVRFTAIQKISTADVEIDIENEERHLHVSAYAPYQESVILLCVEARKGIIPLCVYFAPTPDDSAEYSHHVTGGTIAITKDYIRNVEWETRCAAFCRVIGWDRPEGYLREGQKLFIAVSVRTNHDMADYLETAKRDVNCLTSPVLYRYRNFHLEWWKNFWDTSGIKIEGEPEIEKFWYGSHYLLACCSKGGKYPPGLFGNWITTDAARWLGDYHLNYNYQAPWWGVYSSNKNNVADCYERPLMEMIPRAKQNARIFLGCRGIYAKVGIGPRGLEPNEGFYKDGSVAGHVFFLGQKSNAAYAAVNMIMRFYTTWDEVYTREYAFPYVREVVDFWEDYLVYEDGRYVIYGDSIHENFYDAIGIVDWVSKAPEDYRGDKNPLLSLGLVRMVFRAALDMAEFLGVDEQRREKWEHILTHISAFPTYQREGKKVFRYTEKGFEWVDGNSLAIQHIYPCGAVGLESEEELLQIARNTIAVRDNWEDFNGVPTFYPAAVRVGYDPTVILAHLKEQFEKHAFPNLFLFYGGGGVETLSTVPSCINEMLFQSYEGFLRFFPVWVKEKDASFYRLRGYGAFVVSAKLCGGVVQDVEIISEKGRTCSVLCPWPEGMKILCEGKEVPFEKTVSRSGIIYHFETEAGMQYQLLQHRQIAYETK